MSNPTRAEKFFWSQLAEVVGCIACRIQGRMNNYVSIHHIDGRTKPGAHMLVLPLCDVHHQTGGMQAPSIHPWKSRFEEKFGKQEELLAKCHRIIEKNGAAR